MLREANISNLESTVSPKTVIFISKILKIKLFLINPFRKIGSKVLTQKKILSCVQFILKHFAHPFNSRSVGSFKMTVNVFTNFQKEEWAEAEKEFFLKSRK